MHCASHWEVICFQLMQFRTVDNGPNWQQKGGRNKQHVLTVTLGPECHREKRLYMLLFVTDEMASILSLSLLASNGQWKQISQSSDSDKAYLIERDIDLSPLSGCHIQMVIMWIKFGYNNHSWNGVCDNETKTYPCIRVMLESGLVLSNTSYVNPRFSKPVCNLLYISSSFILCNLPKKQ